jgi:hypothetical protein
MVYPECVPAKHTAFPAIGGAGDQLKLLISRLLTVVPGQRAVRLTWSINRSAVFAYSERPLAELSGRGAGLMDSWRICAVTSVGIPAYCP